MSEEKAQATLQRRLLVLEAAQRLSGPAKRWVTVSDIVKDLKKQGYAAKTHSIRRDLSALLGSHPQLECNDNSQGDEEPKSGLPYGYRWVGKDAPPATGLTLAEAVSLVLVERHLASTLPSMLTEALRDLFAKANNTLDLHKKAPAAHWTEKVAVIPPAQPLVPPVMKHEVRRVVHEALIEETPINVVYRGLGGGQPQERVLHPLGLIQRGPSTYLAALTFDHYNDVRLYALHRIESAVKLDGKVRTLPGFEIGKYADEQGHFGTGKDIRLVAWVSDMLRQILEETRLAEDQQCSGPDKYGWHTVTATVRDTWQLRWWIAEQLEHMVVLEPEALRDEMKRAFDESAENYRGEDDD